MLKKQVMNWKLLFQEQEFRLIGNWYKDGGKADVYVDGNLTQNY